jgi:hypothetical protein
VVIRFERFTHFKPPALRVVMTCARHGELLGGESPLQVLMVETASRRQGRMP